MQARLLFDKFNNDNTTAKVVELIKDMRGGNSPRYAKALAKALTVVVPSKTSPVHSCKAVCAVLVLDVDAGGPTTLLLVIYMGSQAENVRPTLIAVD